MRAPRICSVKLLSSLGRKAMKKTLERLKKDAYTSTRKCSRVFGKMQKRCHKMSNSELVTFEAVDRVTFDAVKSLMMYVKALEDYGYELHEQWDELLSNIEEAQQSPKPSNASYVK